MGKMTINDLSTERTDELLRQIRELPEFKALEKNRNRLLVERRYVEAQKLLNTMKMMEDKILSEYLNKVNEMKVEMNDLIADMSVEDQECMAAYCNAFMMTADAMESFILNANQLIKRYHPYTDFIMFDDLNKVAKMAAEKVKMLEKYKDDAYYMNNYGDAADKVYELIENKARGFFRRMKRHQDSLDKKKK